VKASAELRQIVESFKPPSELRAAAEVFVPDTWHADAADTNAMADYLSTLLAQSSWQTACEQTGHPWEAGFSVGANFGVESAMGGADGSWDVDATSSRADGNLNKPHSSAEGCLDDAAPLAEKQESMGSEGATGTEAGNLGRVDSSLGREAGFSREGGSLGAEVASATVSREVTGSSEEAALGCSGNSAKAEVTAEHSRASESEEDESASQGVFSDEEGADTSADLDVDALDMRAVDKGLVHLACTLCSDNFPVAEILNMDGVPLCASCNVYMNGAQASAEPSSLHQEQAQSPAVIVRPHAEGNIVQVVGLQSGQGLNGRHGYLGQYHPEKGRWEVIFCRGHAPKLIKTCNLLQVELVEVPDIGGPGDAPIGCEALIGGDLGWPCNKPVTSVIEAGCATVRGTKQLVCSECLSREGGRKVADIDSFGVELPQVAAEV